MIVLAVAAAAAVGAWMGIKHGRDKARRELVAEQRRQHVSETLNKIVVELELLEEIFEEINDRLLEEDFDLDEYKRSLTDHPSKPLSDDERDAFYTLVAHEDDE